MGEKPLVHTLGPKAHFIYFAHLKPLLNCLPSLKDNPQDFILFTLHFLFSQVDHMGGASYYTQKVLNKCCLLINSLLFEVTEEEKEDMGKMEPLHVS